MICSRVQICVCVCVCVIVFVLACHPLKDGHSVVNKQDICLKSCITSGKTLWKCALPGYLCCYFQSPCDSQEPNCMARFVQKIKKNNAVKINNNTFDTCLSFVPHETFHLFPHCDIYTHELTV